MRLWAELAIEKIAKRIARLIGISTFISFYILEYVKNARTFQVYLKYFKTANMSKMNG